MHDILRDRILRKLEVLPESQIYEVLDYIEFLEARYARAAAARPDALQRFAERLEDSMRMRSVAPKVISGTVGLVGTARRVLQGVADAGREILGTGEAGGTGPGGSRPLPARRSEVTPPAKDTPPADRD
jgi:hypothetical protein